MASRQHPDDRAFYTRGELELALGRLVLGVERLTRARAQPRDRVSPASQKAVLEFLDQAAQIYARTPPEQRPLALQRLVSIAQSTGLGLVGLEEWLETVQSPHVSSDRHVAVNVSWEGDGPTTTSSGQL